MSSIKILINGSNGGYLDLFENENIELVIKNKDLKDISKIFSDYVKTFSVPHTDNNRKLLGYKMDSDVIYSESNTNKATIFINDSVFKNGYIDVLERKTTNGVFEYFKINFFTGVAEIKDIIGDTKLSELDFTKYKFEWSSQQVAGYISRDRALEWFGTDKLLLPLISNTRAWNYGQGGENDITTDAGRITLTELNPCLSVGLIFDVIFDTLFVRKGYKRPYFPFLVSKDLEDAYMLLNGNRGENKLNYRLLNYSDYSTTGDFRKPFEITSDKSPEAWNEIVISDNTVYNNLMWSEYEFNIRNIVDVVSLDRYKSDLTVSIEYKNSGVTQYVSGTPDGNGNLKLKVRAINKLKGIEAFRIKINAESDVRFDLFTTKIQTASRSSSNAYWSTVYVKDEYGNVQFGDNYFDINGGFGDMKVIDFVGAFLKMCNGSIIPDLWNDGSFLFLTSKEIENPVSPSAFTNTMFDLTEYVDSSDYVKRRQQKYKDFYLTYKESKYYRNKAYKSVVNKEYGSEYFNTKKPFTKDSYTVEVGLNILPYFLMDGTRNFVTSYTFEENGSKATSSIPTIIIMDKKTTVIENSEGNLASIKLDDGRGLIRVITEYTEPKNNNSNTSITYDEYITPFGEFVSQNLFNYYKRDIETINNDNVYYYDFNINIEPSLLLYLNTNAEFLLNGKIVKIEELNISLTTGKGKITVYDYEEPYKINNQKPPTPDHLEVGLFDLPNNVNMSVLLSWGYISGDFDRYKIQLVGSGGKTYLEAIYKRDEVINDTMVYLDQQDVDKLDNNIIYLASISTLNSNGLSSGIRGSQPFSVKK